MHVILFNTSFDHSNCVPDATDFLKTRHLSDKTSVTCSKSQESTAQTSIINYCWHRRLSVSGFFSSKKHHLQADCTCIHRQDINHLSKMSQETLLCSSVVHAPALRPICYICKIEVFSIQCVGGYACSCASPAVNTIIIIIIIICEFIRRTMSTRRLNLRRNMSA